MSVATTIPSIRIRISPHPSRRVALRPSAIVRCSGADGPLRRPAAPSLSPPPPPLSPPTSTSAQSTKPVELAAAAAAAAATKEMVVTLEYQRKVAKELQDYFKQKKLEEANQGPFFGFLGKNEISNGRWAMFGFAVGLLTEYATGASFVQQLKILLSNFGIVDLE
ncbi:unnamed protein product [Musa acuminata subsp. malaccensis]|uniref:(wild Malaysian banana) hypothetical protein n=1 Tax=Musa acuminata subsp. malaccensis TaxID=214687 RepID=A0A804J2N9_MUSAM|nr:PREDICTED: myc-associated zinc finger protein-like [Musa acuminata subsp. malaccensis]CAG1837998.1 unnamed protein product [Musa acuminata subsp. malaccensis]